MKLWTFFELIHFDYKMALDIASSKQEWVGLAEWFRRLHLIKPSERYQLNFDLPDGFVVAALKDSGLRLYVSSDGGLHSCRMKCEDEEMSAFDALNRYGEGPVAMALMSRQAAATL